MTRVLLFVPNLALRIGLHSLLADRADYVVAAEISRLDDVSSLSDDIDIILAAMLRPDEIEALGEMELPFLLLTDKENDVLLLSSSRLPGWGALPIDCTKEDLFSALQAVAQGLLAGAPGLIQRALHQPPHYGIINHKALIEPLTTRELEVLQQMAQGLANKQIGLILGISEHTVKFHLTSIYSKLGVSSRTEAVNAGMQRGLVIL